MFNCFQMENPILKDAKFLPHPLHPKGRGDNSQATGGTERTTPPRSRPGEPDRRWAARGTLAHDNVHTGNKNSSPPLSPLKPEHTAQRSATRRPEQPNGHGRGLPASPGACPAAGARQPGALFPGPARPAPHRVRVPEARPGAESREDAAAPLRPPRRPTPLAART